MKHTKINKIVHLSYADQYEYFKIIQIENTTIANKLFWLINYEYGPKKLAKYCLVSDESGKIEFEFNFGEKEAIEITEQFMKKYLMYQNHKIVKAVFNSNFDVIGNMGWIITGEFELFGETRESFFVVSAETGILEYTFNEHGRRNSHLEKV